MLETGIGNAIIGIYDAVLSDEHWPSALDGLTRSVGAAGATLMVVDRVGLDFQIMQITPNYDRSDIQGFMEKLGEYDLAVMSRIMPVTPPFRLVRDEDVWGDVSQLENRSDYRWLRETYGINRRGGVRLSADKGWVDLLGLQFAEGDWRKVPSSMHTSLRTLLPHLAKAVEVNRTFSLLRASYRAVMSALDYVIIGVAIVAQSGVVIASNREARRILALNDGIRQRRDGQLECSNPSQNIELSAAVTAIATTSRGQASVQERLLYVRRKSEKLSFLIEVAPLRDAAGEVETGFAGAVAFLIDPENLKAISIDKLVGLFGLTQGEAEIARAMVDGFSAAEIADLRGTKEETVRTQFKSIYAKTGVHRRAEFLCLAISVNPPIQPLVIAPLHKAR